METHCHFCQIEIAGRKMSASHLIGDEFVRVTLGADHAECRAAVVVRRPARPKAEKLSPIPTVGGWGDAAQLLAKLGE